MSEHTASDDAPIAAALGAIITYDGVTRTETLEIPQVIQLSAGRPTGASHIDEVTDGLFEREEAASTR